MTKYQEFLGIKFREEWPGGYYIHNFTGYNIRMHRFVWEYYNGSIPKGYDVHHIDGNRSNNDISNLQLLKSSDHKRLHGTILTDNEREWRKQNINNCARPKAIEWHKSTEGRKWHSNHMKSQWKTDAFLTELICSECGKIYLGYKKDIHTFCSDACKSKYRRKSGIDDIERICPVCNKTFTVNRYTKKVCCSKHCSMILRHRKGK